MPPNQRMDAVGARPSVGAGLARPGGAAVEFLDLAAAPQVMRGR